MASTSWCIRSGVVDFSITLASSRRETKPSNHGRRPAIAMSLLHLSKDAMHASSGCLKRWRPAFGGVCTIAGHWLHGRRRDSAEISDVLPLFEAFRRERTDVVQTEARKQGLRLDSRTGSLQQRDQEIAKSVEFRKWLFDYDVEKAAIAYFSKCRKLARQNPSLKLSSQPR
jgi:hypothetical protein